MTTKASFLEYLAFISGFEKPKKLTEGQQKILDALPVYEPRKVIYGRDNVATESSSKASEVPGIQTEKPPGPATDLCALY